MNQNEDLYLRLVFETGFVRGIKKGIEIIKGDIKEETKEKTSSSEETLPEETLPEETLLHSEYEKFKKEYEDLIYLEQEGIIESKEEQLFKNIYFYYLMKIRDRMNVIEGKGLDEELRLEWENFLRDKEKIDRLEKEKYRERESYREGYEDCAKELLGEDEAKKFLVGKKNF